MSPPLATFDAVTKSFGFFDALKDVSFDLLEGEVFGYIGPNGAGKTTTLKVLVGLIQRFGGRLTVAGHSVPAEREAVYGLVGFLPQAAGFHSWRTAQEALLSLGLLSGVEGTQLRRRIDHYLDRFDLTEARHKKIKQLSGGMAQKLGFVQALLHKPRLLVLDEPLSGLDPASRSLVKEVIREVRAEGTTVIFSSHILSDVQDVADRIGVIHSGKIVTTGTVDQLKEQFGAPAMVSLRFAKPPDNLTFLEPGAFFEHTEDSNGRWLLRLRDPSALDDAIAFVIDKTLAGGGRIRAVAPFEPNLDDLYVRYIAKGDDHARA